MPSSFLLAGMQRSWQEAKQPSWRVRKPHTKDEGKEPGYPDHVAKSPSPTWPAYLDSFLERKLCSCNKPQRIFCVFFQSWIKVRLTHYLHLQRREKLTQTQPMWARVQRQLWFLTSGFQPSPRLPWEVHRICRVGKKALHFPYRPPGFPGMARTSHLGEDDSVLLFYPWIGTVSPQSQSVFGITNHSCFPRGCCEGRDLALSCPR